MYDGRRDPVRADDRVGRSITAALLTFDDVRRQVIGDRIELGRFPRRDGGVRGGAVRINSTRRMRLRGVVYVPGVRIFGSVSFSPGATHILRISGRRAAHGRIIVTPKTSPGASAAGRSR